jgi:hypothetical protein
MKEQRAERREGSKWRVLEECIDFIPFFAPNYLPPSGG